MDIAEYLPPDHVALDVKVRDKSQLLAEIGRHFARLAPDLPPGAVETALQAREQLGSTGLGNGFALPHARIEGLKGYAGLFLRLSKPIEFDAIDGKPVGMVFALLIPFDSAVPHVQALAAISRRFRDANVLAALRQARTTAEAHQVLTR